MRGHPSPGILFAIDDGQTVVSDVVAAVFINRGHVRGGGEVEGVAADDGFILQSQ